MLAIIIGFTLIRTTATLTSLSETIFFGAAQANLRGVNLSEKPQDWLPRNLAKAQFRSRWCRENEIETCINALSTSNGAFLRSPVGGVSEDEELFEVEWRTQRTSQLASLRKTTLRGKDLRGADIVRASLEGVDLSLARLELADLSRSNLEGADIKKASLRGAFLRGTLLEAANLQSVKLQGANLTGARLEDVDIADANLEATRLNSAFVSGSPDRPIDFSRANLRGSIWRDAALRWSTLSAVEMAELLYFETTFGDASVSLPAGYPIPCQWADKILSDAEFFGRWRGWIEATSRRPSVEFLMYRSIPPPAGCGPTVLREPAHSDDQHIDPELDD